MKCNCCVCGKEFDRKASLVKRAKNPTCSKECRNKMYTFDKKEIKCVICGKTMYMLESRLKYRKNPICSDECKKQLLSNLKTKEKIKLKCPMCNKYFEVYPYRIKNQLNICCSQSCATRYREQDKTKHPNYNPNLSEEDRINRRILKENVIWRNKVFEKDNFTCQICKQYGGKLEAHHLNGYHWDKEHRLDINNGITLCQKCHNDFHKKYGKCNNIKEQFIEYANQSGS